MYWQHLKRAALFCLVVVLWEIAVRKGFVNKFLLPAPSTIADSEALSDPKLLMHVLASLSRVVVGYSISVVVGVTLGFILGLNTRLRFYCLPLLAVLKPIPPIAWIPIAILWFGLGNGPSYFITMLASFFPIFFSTMAGIEDMDPQYLNVARCFGASRLQIFGEVIFPYTLPFIFSGLRIGLGIAWMSVIAAEIVSAGSGLGYMIEIAQQMLRVDTVIVGMVAIGLCGIALDILIVRLSKQFTGWKA